MFTITVSEKGGQQSTFEFNKPEITIGRMKGNDIVLPKGNVSKRHSRIFAQDAAFSIIDLESTNGTYVNGRKIAGEQPITDADKIYIGDFILQVEDANRLGAGPPPPAPPMGGMRQPSGMQPPVDRQASGVQAPAERQASGLQPAAGGFDSGFGSGPSAPIPPSPPVAPPGPPDPGPPPADMGGGFSNFEPAQQPQQEPPPQNGGFGGGAPMAPPPAPEAPMLQGDWPPRAQDDVTVDRFGDRMMPRAEYSQVSAILQENDLESEFDADFHAAQHDVATVLFENLAAADLPLNYPPSPGDADKLRKDVQSAVDTVGPSVNKDELVDLMTAECVGLGPIDAYLDDPEVRDIYVNQYDHVLVRKDGKLVQAARAFSHPDLLTAAALRLIGPREVDVYSDELRFDDGTKVHVITPPLAVNGPAITVRKPPASHPTLDALVGSGALSQGMAEFLVRATEAGRSILIAGPTSSGKSTLLSALTQQMAAGVRCVAVENNASIALSENSVRLEANPNLGYDMGSLVRTALTMHPQRVIVDECRGAEAYDWVTAAACGTEGSMATLHGTSATDALGRLESLCLLGSADVSPRGLREQIARAVSLVVVVNRAAGSGFRVQQVTEVQGVDLDAFRLNDVFYHRVEGTEGAFHPTGYIPLFYEDLRHAGVDVDLGIFRE